MITIMRLRRFRLRPMSGILSSYLEKHKSSFNLVNIYKQLFMCIDTFSYVDSRGFRSSIFVFSMNLIDEDTLLLMKTHNLMYESDA